MMMTAIPVPTTDDDDDLTAIDRNALDRAISQIIEGPDQGRREQVLAKLETEPWARVAMFATGVRQAESLELKPWDTVPCHIDPDRIEEILAAGPDGHRDYKAAKLVSQLLDLGLSQFEPDPGFAIAAAKQKARRR
jgi:hypothetical protein